MVWDLIGQHGLFALLLSAPVENSAIVQVENETTQTDWLGDLCGGLGADQAAGCGWGSAAAGRTAAGYWQVNGGGAVAAESPPKYERKPVVTSFSPFEARVRNCWRSGSAGPGRGRGSARTWPGCGRSTAVLTQRTGCPGCRAMQRSVTCGSRRPGSRWRTAAAPCRPPSPRRTGQQACQDPHEDHPHIMHER